MILKYILITSHIGGSVNKSCKTQATTFLEKYYDKQFNNSTFSKNSLMHKVPKVSQSGQLGFQLQQQNMLSGSILELYDNCHKPCMRYYLPPRYKQWMLLNHV